MACYAGPVDYMLGARVHADVGEVIAVVEQVADLELQVVADG